MPEIVATLQDIHKQGKILSFGCSNWKPPRIEEALAIPGVTFTANQVLGNVFCRLPRMRPDPTNEIIDAAMFSHAVANDRTLYLYSSTAHGYFERLRCRSSAAPRVRPAEGRRRCTKVQQIAQDAGVEPAHMILAALLQLARECARIIGPRSVGHLRAAWKACRPPSWPMMSMRKTFAATGMGDFLG